MSFKTALCALVIALTTTAAYASCSARGHQAQSCAAGTVWDANSQTCVEQVNS
ncbi:MAG: adenylosuccinate lyase [Rhodobacteraceae bacterium]|nr:adenylosuccinate lyase [Paracoccaceae bacterium]